MKNLVCTQVTSAAWDPRRKWRAIELWTKVTRNSRNLKLRTMRFRAYVRMFINGSQSHLLYLFVSWSKEQPLFKLNWTCCTFCIESAMREPSVGTRLQNFFHLTQRYLFDPVWQLRRCGVKDSYTSRSFCPYAYIAHAAENIGKLIFLTEWDG